MARYRSRYEELLGELPEPNDEHEVSILCPFHEDRKRSASINVESGLFNCMACETSYNYIGFKKAHTQEHGFPDKAASGDDPEEKVISDQTVRDLHFDLMTNQEVLDRLGNERGISVETIKRWQIGWDKRTRRVAIPIRDEQGRCRNVRLYHFDKSGQQKMISWRAGYGTARLWPMEAFDEDYVILAEGEMDRMVLWEQGINAVTSTGGAKTWKTSWSEHFKDMKVRIVYDMDDAGEEGARKAAASIAAYAEEVKVVTLDLTNKGEDITDYFVNYGYGVDDFRKLCSKAPIFRKPIKKEEYTSQGNGKAPWVTLGQSLDPAYRQTEIMVPVIVASRRDERLHYPAVTEFSCNQDAGAPCKKCNLNGSGEATVRIRPSDSRLTKFVGIADNQERALVKKWAGVPTACNVVDQQITESGTIEEILITPEIDTSAKDSMHLIQRAFYVGLGLEYNSSYVLRSKPIPFHKNLKIVHQIVDATPSHDSIDSFEMTPETKGELSIFQAEPGKAKRKLWEIATDLQDHTTRIWDRLMLHLGMDLIWHSVLEFEFDGKYIRRGWLEAIVVGDTRTGKSEIASQLLDHYGYGEMVSGENTSYAGLVGGAIKFDDAWFVKWGRIPLNDRRLVVIDEITGMAVEDIGRMSNVRESGIADVTKIETQKANARTRALWISNVRPPRQDLSDYDHGCLALNDVIGMPEDVARFDYAMSAARDEVSATIVNSTHPVEGEQKYTSELCSELIRWVWSRSADTIAFERGAVDACYRHAVEMGKVYDTAMPLVMSENQRIKLARIAAAIAGRLFSTNDGETLIVTAEHVDVARDLLDAFYSKESFGYRQFSLRTKIDEQRRKEGEKLVVDHLTSRPELADVLVQFRLVTPKRVASYTGVSEQEAEESLRLLSRFRLTEDKGSHGRSVTPQLKAIAERVTPTDYSFRE